MPFVITNPCVGVKDTACVVVCPMDCIHPRPEDPAFATVDQLFIDPDVCITCNMCLDECPVRAIFDEPDVPTEWAEYVELNARFFAEKK